jgi:thiamine pyrophosphokinase
VKSNAGSIAKKLARRKRRIEHRLQAARDSRFVRMAAEAPAVFSSTGLKYELAQQTHPIVSGGAVRIMSRTKC